MWWDSIEETIKGFQYASQPDRLTIHQTGSLIFRGNHQLHILTLTQGGLLCDCAAFTRFQALGPGWCRHTIAVERILETCDAGTTVVATAELVQ